MTRLLHFSDIHFKSPECNDLETDPNTSIRDLLSLDIIQHCAKDKKNVDAILITGDIAFAGRKDEYEVASSWIDELCLQTGCRKQDVYVVPGNHDVDRSLSNNTILNALRNEISTVKNKTKRDQKFSEYLSDSKVGDLLLHPMQNYNHFAARYNCNISHENTHWSHVLPITEEVELNIRGITTTIFSSSNDDLSTLIVDNRQISFRKKPGQVHLTMMHHPCDWLMDSDDIKDQLDNHIQIQLFGHKHRARWESGDNYLRVSAISLHPDRGEPGYEPGYNIIDLSQDKVNDDNVILDAKVVVRVLQLNPMQFNSKKFGNNDFILKTFEVPKKFNINENNSEPHINTSNETALTSNITAVSNVSTQQIEIEKEEKINIKDLSYSFWQLKGSKKREIINSLNLLSDEEWEQPEVERQKIAFIHAQKNGKLEQLQNAILEQRK